VTLSRTHSHSPRPWLLSPVAAMKESAFRAHHAMEMSTTRSMKNDVPYMTLGLFALFGATGCPGSVSSTPVADGGPADGASTAGDSASAPDTAIGDSASHPDTAIGDETAPSADATPPASATDATFADAGVADATIPSTDAAPLPDGTFAEDSLTWGDSAIGEDDSSLADGDSAVAEGGSCTGFTTGDPTCDLCIVANCCAAAAACNTGSAGVTACEQSVSCVEDTCGDGGVSGECLLTCLPDEVSPADALITCIGNSCSTECN
jgi:hypothetical protein